MRNKITEIISNSGAVTQQTREWIWANYPQLLGPDRSSLLGVLAEDPQESDVRFLDRILSEDRDWLCRVHATEALGILGTAESIKILERQFLLEANHLVRFFIGRELLDNHSPMIGSFLEQSLPEKRTPLKRQLWTYGKYKLGEVSIRELEQILGEIPEWLQDEWRDREGGRGQRA